MKGTAMRLDTKEKRLQARDAEIEYLKSKDGKVQKIHDLIIVRFFNARLCVKIYKGTSYHPIAYYSFKTEEQREKTIDSCIASAKRRLAYKTERQRKQSEFQPTLKTGDILVDSWGYDQTNIDFYQILSVKGKIAIVQEIGLKHVDGSGGFMCCNVLPAIGKFVEDSKPEKKRICKGDCIKTHIGHAYKWDGTEMYSSWYA